MENATRTATLTIAVAAALSACATAPPDLATPGGAPTDTCRAEPGQRFVGERATAETGAAILAATDARELRWIPPGVMVTMEYKFGRVTVAYGENYQILRVSCG